MQNLAKIIPRAAICRSWFHSRRKPELLVPLVKAYMMAILAVLSLTPSWAIGYLAAFQDPALRVEHHAFHEIAICASLLISGFIAYVTWRCYLRSGEPTLRWLTLGFAGFTVIYAMHGAMTRLSADNIWSFILYGPASRLALAGCLLAGLRAYGELADRMAIRHRPGFWLAWSGAFIGINALVYVLARTPWAAFSRLLMEGCAMCIFLVCAGLIVKRRIRSPMMAIYALSALVFAQSSLAFLLGRAWNHQWWLAHAVFAVGFMALSYGVVNAFLTTGSFSRVYSVLELMRQIRAEKDRTERALVELQQAHRDLELLASTDVLTGAASRREFTSRANVEIARAVRSGAPISFLLLDLDRFKQVNDLHGHHVGDDVLRACGSVLRKEVRASDLVGRLGGEEFVVMLPDTEREAARTLAERLRRALAELSVGTGNTEVRVTASFGVAQAGIDGGGLEAVLEIADARMYTAKRQGRNQVVTR